ncbi:MAG: aldehyde ferredoxin oxidoreductase, partial [Clostridia bacterium]|nr:aldehyde ferredoxin oxidoreductase [Clostridia bacterium]
MPVERIARVNMAEKEIRYEEVPRDLYLMGGRALVSTVVAREVDPMCHPLGRRNKVVIAPSLLAGTGASSTDRLSIGVKSPLTQGIKESNAGGTVGRTMSLL